MDEIRLVMASLADIMMLAVIEYAACGAGVLWDFNPFGVGDRARCREGVSSYHPMDITGLELLDDTPKQCALLWILSYVHDRQVTPP